MSPTRRITAKTRIYQLEIELARIRPPVWRRLLVSGETDLGELHDVIQTAFGWTNSHLHQFEIGEQVYATPDPDWDVEVEDEARSRLFRLAEEGSRLTYTYDFGDNWEHHVTVDKVLDPQAGMRYPTCAAGDRACPPEDVGGPSGYANFLAALADPGHDGHAEWTQWIGGSFDSEAFDLTSVNAALKKFVWATGPIGRAR